VSKLSSLGSLFLYTHTHTCARAYIRSLFQCRNAGRDRRGCTQLFTAARATASSGDYSIRTSPVLPHLPSSTLVVPPRNPPPPPRPLSTRKIPRGGVQIERRHVSSSPARRASFYVSAGRRVGWEEGESRVLHACPIPR